MCADIMSYNSALSFLLFVILFRKIFLHPTEAPEDVISMGRSLEAVPMGSESVKRLNLAYNHIATLPDYIFANNSYKSLTKLELNQNRISAVSAYTFRGLRHLTAINLADNNVSALDPYTFKSNAHLDRLDLSRNRLVFSPIQVFLVARTLRTLLASGNCIQRVYEVTFLGMPNLESLMLDHNALAVVEANAFKALRKLQYVSLAGTGVFRLSEAMFGPSLPRIVDLQETPLAKRFEPPLERVTGNAVRSLVRVDKLDFSMDEAP